MVAFVEMRALHLKADGSEIQVNPVGRHFTLKELQACVGGYIEMIPLGEELTMVLNEEGKLNDLPLNAKATKLFRLYHGDTDFIVGDVLVAKNEDLD